jgi:hypothetical protein
LIASLVTPAEVDVSTSEQDVLVLDWLSAPGCPRTHEIEAQVASLVVDRSPELRLHASGSLHQVGDGAAELVLDLEWEDQHERFELHGSDCVELGRLAAELIANVIDPFGYVHLQTRAPLPVPVSIHVPRAERPEPILVEPEQLVQDSTPTEVSTAAEFGELYTERDALQRGRASRRVPLDGVLEAQAMGLAAAELGVVAYPRIGLGLELGRARVRAGGGAWFGGEFRSPTMPEIGGSVRGWTVELGGCWLPGVGRVEFPLCAGAGAGRMIATGMNVSDSTTARQPWVWLAAEAGAEWWLVRRFALTLGLAGGASLVRPAFEVRGSDAALDVPIGYVRFGGGLAVRFIGHERPRTFRRTPPTDPPTADSNVP